MGGVISGKREMGAEMDISADAMEAVDATAFYVAAELHDLMRSSGLNERQIGYATGLAGRLFFASLYGGQGREPSRSQIASFNDAVNMGLKEDATCGIDDINGVIAASPVASDEVSGSAVIPKPVVPVAFDREKLDSAVKVARNMAMNDFKNAFKSGGFSIQEIAFVHGMSLSILLGLAGKFEPELKVGPVDVVSGALQGIAQRVNVNVKACDGLAVTPGATIH